MGYYEWPPETINLTWPAFNFRLGLKMLPPGRFSKNTKIEELHKKNSWQVLIAHGRRNNIKTSVIMDYISTVHFKITMQYWLTQISFYCKLTGTFVSSSCRLWRD